MTIETNTHTIARSTRDPIISQTVKENANYAAYEAHRPHEAWDYPSRPLHQIENFFMDVYPSTIPREPNGVVGWLQQYEDMYVLNAMGGSHVLEDLSTKHALSAGVAMGLSKRTDSYLTEKQIALSSGDIITQGAWTNLDDTMSELSINAFNLILFYPQNGGTTAHLTSYPDITMEIYQRLYDRLAPGGILLAEVTEAWINNHSLNYFAQAVRTIDPASILHNYNRFSLVKTDALHTLPVEATRSI